MRRRLQIVRDCRRGKLALEVGNFQRFEPEALARHNLVFHAVFRANKQNAAAGLALLKQPRHRNGWVNMPARAAAGKDDVHTRLRQTRFPLSKSPRFLTAYSSLLSFCREMLRIKPTSKS